MMRSREQFIREQGFGDVGAEPSLYQALMFQPRAVGVLLVIGTAMQSGWLLEVLFGAGGGAVVFTRFCAGALLYRAVAARRAGVHMVARQPVKRA